MKLATATQMQCLDKAAINDFAIPGVVLMENAGQGTVNQMEAVFGPVRGKTVCIFIGPGNNGGDGLVIGRHVLQRGGFPCLFYLVPPDKLQNDAAINAAICEKMQLASFPVEQESAVAKLSKKIETLHFDHPVHSLVDALFGTGLQRTLEGRFAAVVRLINRIAQKQHWPVVAVDIPSGLSADSGATLGCSIKADLTVTYGLAKPGHYLHGGSAVGKLAVLDISIPEQVVKQASLPGSVLDQNIHCLLHQRNRVTHKGSFGHLFIIAGSEGKTGAAILCAQAALHSGCGLVSMGVPADLNPIFETCLPEAMTSPLPDSPQRITQTDYELIRKLLTDKDALVIGPGLGTDPATSTLVQRLYRELPLPMLVDADALNILAPAPDCIRNPAGIRILTPHPGEMSRLTGKTTGEIQSDRIRAAKWLDREQINTDCEIITVLKGAGTVLCTSNGQWAINSSGNNGMATGGMGDVLAGLIGSLLAQHYSPWAAAKLGVFIHGLAADLLAEERPFGFTASEVAAALPLAFSLLQQQEGKSMKV
jgi:NAD(P)H-hydrate epimerase